MRPEDRFRLLYSCAKYVGLTPSEVMSIVSNAPVRYKVFHIPKRSGSGERTVCQPARELKALQYFIIRQILRNIPVHEAATAYKAGASIRKNAEMHVNSRVILKLDLIDFFGSIKVADWRAFSAGNIEDWNDFNEAFTSRVLFWGRGNWEPDCLAIGAPSSPMLSNIFMFEFDEQMSQYAQQNNLIYSRYADDITFSSRGFLDKEAVLATVEICLRNHKWCQLRLNARKTKLSSKSFARRVTGLVLANDGVVSLGRERKRLIRSMVHRALAGEMREAELSHLRGMLAFAHDAEPEFVEALRDKYGHDRLNRLFRI